MQHVLARLMKGKLVPSLSQWRAAATALRLEAREKERQSKLLDRMRRRMLHKCAFSALLAWDHFVGERKRLRALALHVLNRLSRGKIVLALDRWRAVLREEKQNELQHDRVEKLMRRVALRLKMRASSRSGAPGRSSSGSGGRCGHSLTDLSTARSRRRYLLGGKSGAAGSFSRGSEGGCGSLVSPKH